MALIALFAAACGGNTSDSDNKGETTADEATGALADEATGALIDTYLWCYRTPGSYWVMRTRTQFNPESRLIIFYDKVEVIDYKDGLATIEKTRTNEGQEPKSPERSEFPLAFMIEQLDASFKEKSFSGEEEVEVKGLGKIKAMKAERPGSMGDKIEEWYWKNVLVKSVTTNTNSRVTSTTELWETNLKP